MINKSKTRNVMPGELFYLSSGEYSDYQVKGIYKCLKEFSPDEFACPATVRAFSEFYQKWSEYFNEGAFILMLVNGGYIEQVPAFEFHLSDYSDYEPSITEYKK